MSGKADSGARVPGTERVCGRCGHEAAVYGLSAVKERMWPPVLTCGLLSLLGL